MMRKLLLASLMAAALTGCIKPSPYQPLGPNGGYSELALDENVYRVSFKGNTMTPRQEVDDLMLRRAAELTVQKGYSYFAVTNKRLDENTYTYQTPTTITTTRDKKHREQTAITESRTYTSHDYVATAMIRMFHSKQGHPRALNAETILSNYAGIPIDSQQ